MHPSLQASQSQGQGEATRGGGYTQVMEKAGGGKSSLDSSGGGGGEESVGVEGGAGMKRRQDAIVSSSDGGESSKAPRVQQHAQAQAMATTMPEEQVAKPAQVNNYYEIGLYPHESCTLQFYCLGPTINRTLVVKWNLHSRILHPANRIVIVIIRK
jgi:hypothetical protein